MSAALAASDCDEYVPPDRSGDEPGERAISSSLSWTIASYRFKAPEKEGNTPINIALIDSMVPVLRRLIDIDLAR